MIKVLVVSPFSKDANSYHRAMGPWNYATKVNRQKNEACNGLQICLAEDDLGHKGMSWDTISQFDAVFLHRPCRPDDVTIIRIARNMNIPTWVDYDDYLFGVPNWNPTHNIYSNPGLQNCVAMATATADIVSVTTEALFTKIKPVNKNVVIIPNSYRKDLYPYRETVMPKRNKVFAWRGTNTHVMDLLSVIEGFKKFEHPTHFYGDPTWMVLNEMRSGAFQQRGSQDPFMYMKQIYNDAPKVLVCPLVDCFFNRVKSNIAYQEALHAGALCVGPNIPEWHRPGVITYTPGDWRSFLDASNQAMDMNEDEHRRTADEAYYEMNCLYGAEHINELRMKTLHQMLSSDFKRNDKDPLDQLVGVWAMSLLKEKVA